MKKLMLLLLALGLIAGTALAKAPLEKPLVPYQGDARAIEVEPNNDSYNANAWDGSDMQGAIVAEDADFFAFFAHGGTIFDFQTNPIEGGVALDSKLYIYDVDGITQLGYNDDGGNQGYYSLITGFEFPADGTYYIAVTGYSAYSTGDYMLTSSETVVVPPPANDDCDGAIALLDGVIDFTVDLCLYSDTYSPSYGGCTGYSANGPEAVYWFELLPGGSASICMDNFEGYADLAIYLVEDCTDIDGSCVAGDDTGNPECISYTSDGGGIYYLMVDTYSGCSVVSVTGEIVNPVAALSSDWGTVKALY
jgi:hypothetical protein